MRGIARDTISRNSLSICFSQLSSLLTTALHSALLCSTWFWFFSCKCVCVLPAENSFGFENLAILWTISTLLIWIPKWPNVVWTPVSAPRSTRRRDLPSFLLLFTFNYNLFTCSSISIFKFLRLLEFARNLLDSKRLRSTLWSTQFSKIIISVKFAWFL